MNMQQRRYIVKNRIEPMQSKVSNATRNGHWVFAPYVSWGEFVSMVKRDELTVARSHYHRSIKTSSLHTTYENPFGPEAAKKLGASGGVTYDEEARTLAFTEWKQRFTHAVDFMMLASEDTIVALLHNLEAAVEDYCTAQTVARTEAEKAKVRYVDWLRNQTGETHDYPS